MLECHGGNDCSAPVLLLWWLFIALLFFCWFNGGLGFKGIFNNGKSSLLT